ESGSGTHQQTSRTKLPAIRHVFVVMLSNQPYAGAFGPASTAQYLAHTLERRGELLLRYDAVAHQQLANAIPLLSGQGPTPQIPATCPFYADIAPAPAAATGQLTGDGCVFPATTRTVGDQLAAKHRTWKAYVEGLPVPPGQAGACPLPAAGQADPTTAP